MAKSVARGANNVIGIGEWGVGSGELGGVHPMKQISLIRRNKQALFNSFQCSFNDLFQK